MSVDNKYDKLFKKVPGHIKHIIKHMYVTFFTYTLPFRQVEDVDDFSTFEYVMMYDYKDSSYEESEVILVMQVLQSAANIVKSLEIEWITMLLEYSSIEGPLETNMNYIFSIFHVRDVDPNMLWIADENFNDEFRGKCEMKGKDRRNQPMYFYKGLRVYACSVYNNTTNHESLLKNNAIILKGGAETGETFINDAVVNVVDEDSRQMIIKYKTMIHKRENILIVKNAF